MTTRTLRIIVAGGSDAGKTAFIESVGAVATGGSTTANEKSVTFKSGDDFIKFVFVELPSDKFESFFKNRSKVLPTEFKHGHGVAFLFSYADNSFRDACNYWLNFLFRLDQGDGLKPTIVVVGNKADLKETGSHTSHFISEFNDDGLIGVDSHIMESTHDLSLSPMRVLVHFAEKMLDLRKNINFLAPVLSSPPVGILFPTAASQRLLKPIVLRVGEPTVIGRLEIHTGYTAEQNSLAVLRSISRQHIEVVYQDDGTTSLTKLSPELSTVSILNPNGRCIQAIRMQNKQALVPIHGMIDLNHGTGAEAIYKVGSFDFFVNGPAPDSGALSISSLLQEQDLVYKKHVKLLEAELVRSYDQVESLEKLVALGGVEIEERLNHLSLIVEEADHSDDESDADIYAGDTQTY
jgi:GTPase SAR1 family protein